MRLAFACAVAVVLILSLASTVVFAASGSDRARKAAAKPNRVACFVPLVKPAQPVKRGSNSLFRHITEVCRPSGTTGTGNRQVRGGQELPSYVPDHLADELGDPGTLTKANASWATLGTTLKAASKFTGTSGTASIRLVGAPAANRVGFENGAAYAASGYTAIQSFHGRSMKESIVVPKRLGTRTWSWKLQLSGNRRPRLTPQGGVDLRNGLFVPAPVVTRADGTRLPAQPAWSLGLDGSINLELDDRHYPVPYVIDPGVVPSVGFTGFTATSGNTYIDPAFSLSRIFINTALGGSFTVNAGVNDPDDVIPTQVCFPVYGSGWTADGGCVSGASGVSQAGTLATYYSGTAAAATPAAYPGSAFTTSTYGADMSTPSTTDCSNGASGVGPFSRIDSTIDSYANWGTPGFNDDAPITELCVDDFSAKYEGTIRTTATGGTYYFGAISDDGVRVTVDNQLVLAEWGTHATQWNTSCGINLAASTTYPIKVEYFESGATNRMQLRWNTAGSGVQVPPAGTTSCNTPDPVRTMWTKVTATGVPWVPTGTNLSPASPPAVTPTTTWPVVPAAATAAAPGLRLPSSIFNRTYTWTPSAAAPSPASQNIVVEDQAAPDPTPGTAPFMVIADSTGPSGGTINVTTPAAGGLTSTATASLTWNAANTNDGAPGTGSGVTGTGSIWRQETAFDNGNDTCDAFPATWTAGNSTSVRTGITLASSQAGDASLAAGMASGKCYRWALVFNDNVGNVGAQVSEVVRVDSTAPSGSVTLTPAANPQWMYASGSTMFFNNGAGHSGSFVVAGSSSDAESGLDRIQFPATTAGWTPNAPTSVTSAPFEITYAWNSGTGASGPHTASVRDRALNTGTTTSYEFVADSTAPVNGSVTYANSLWSSTSYTVGFNVGDDGAGAGVASWSLERQSSALSPAGTCAAFTGTWAPVGGANPAGTSFADTIAPNMCYQWRLLVTDRVGNVQANTSTNVLRFDQFAPVASFLGIGSPSGNVYLQPLTSTIWFNPGAPGSFTAQVTATDGVGMDRVSFPTTGAAGWTGPTPADDLSASGTTWESASYAWGTGSGDPASLNAVARDIAGNTTSVPFEIDRDSTAPSGGTAEPDTTIRSTLSVALTLTAPTETQSGVQGWSIDVQQGTFLGSVCGAYGGWVPSGLSGTGAVPASATHTVASTGCYRYRLITRDNVGNIESGVTSTGAARIDRTTPGITVVGPPNASSQTGTFGITGTINEPTTAPTSGSVTFAGPSAGTACASPTFTPSGAGTWNWNCSWATPAVDGLYTLTISNVDAAGNTDTTTWQYLIDNAPPTASWTSWSENSSYLHAPGGANPDLLWYNPAAPAAGSGTATATVTATDGGAGMDRVVFPALGAAGWGPGGTDSTVGAADTWTFGYSFTGGGAIGDPALQNATAYDLAGASTGAPALNFRIEPDAAGPTGATYTSSAVLQSSVSFAAIANVGTDAGSGVGGWRLDFRYAPLDNGVCGAWEPWNDGSMYAGFNGAASNGQSIGFTIRLDDSNADGVPDYTESLCFQTQLFSSDHVGNVGAGTLSGVQRFDFGNPTTTLSVPASGSATVTVSGVATDAVTATAPGYALSGSGLSQVDVTYLLPDGPDADLLPDASGSVCTTTTFTGAWTSAAWTCPWNTSALPDGLYTVSATARDAAGRTSIVSSSTILIDNQAPIVAWHSWNTNGSPWMHALGSVAWVNPTAPAGAYALDARATAYDLGSGMNRVDAAALGAGWTPAGASTATLTSPTPVANAWTRSFTFGTPSALAAPGTKQLTAVDNAGNGAPVAFEVRLDGAAPTGGAAAVAAGRQNTPTVAVNLTAGIEGALESGLAAWTVQYDVAPLANDTCGAFPGTWTTLAVGGTGVGIPPASVNHDVTALGSQCYRYRLISTDNVGNIATSAASAGARRVDLVAPGAAFTSPASGSAGSSTVSVTGTASDSHTGVDHVKLEWLGPDGADADLLPDATGTVCDPATLAGSSPTWTWSCSWSTGALLDGTYTLRATSYDRAGSASTPVDITVLLDNQPPFIGFHSFTESTPYTYWSGPVGTNDTIWYNPSAPAGTYGFDVNVTSFDLGSGVSRVEFDGAGTGWTPTVAPATDTTASGTPAANSYTATYTFNTSGAGPSVPPALKATTFDPANNPGVATFHFAPDAAPATGTGVAYANGFSPSTTIPVTYTYGTDGAGSGIADWQLYRSDATLSAGACVGWGAPYSILTVTGPHAGSATYNDTVVDQTCIRYELRTTDQVGNVATATSANVVKLDLATPTGSITLAPTTNAGAQFLVNPTRLFVNTTQAGSFTATVNATASSGVLDAAFPTLAAGFTAGSTVPGPGPTFTQVYGWGVGASAPGAPAATVRSNGLGSLALPFDVVVDTTGPTGGSATHTAGYTAGSAVTVSYTPGSDGVGAGVQSWQLQREVGTLAAGVCTWAGGFVDIGPASGAGSYADASLLQAKCYRYRINTTDKVGNVGSSPSSAPIMVDQTGPTGATITLTTGTNPGNQYLVSGSSIWVNPTLTGSFNATVTATDAESGTGAATFPALGAGWTTTTGGPATAAFAWVGGAAAPGSPSVLVANGSGLTTSISFTVQLDGTAPAGATLDQQAGIDTDFSVDLAYAVGADADTGIASWSIERRSAPYDPVIPACGTWNAWGTYPLPTGHPASPYVDMAVSQPTCYQYRLVETDRVGNQQVTSDGDTVIVIDDIFPPAAFSLNLPTNPALPAITTAAAAPGCGAVPTYASATPAIDWTDSSDPQSGLAGYDVYLDGSGAATNVVAPTSTLMTGALTEGGHTVGVRAVDNQLNFTNAGPAYPAAFRVDSLPPTASATSPAAGSWTPDATPTLTWSAADTNCLARIEVYLDDMVTPVAIASGTEGAWTPSTGLAEGTHQWRIVAIDAVDHRTSSATVSFSVDTTAPSAFTLVSPAGGETVRGSISVSWTSSSDAGSGLGALTAYEVWIDGTLRTTVGSAITTASVPGITNGAHSILVRAVDLVGNSRDTTPASFTGYGVIPAPTLVSPAAGATLNTIPTMTWTWPSDGGPAPTSYDVLVDGAVVGTTTHPTTALTIPDPGDGTHTWQVRQLDPYTGTTLSVTRSFLLDRTAPTASGTLTRVATTVSWPAPSDPAAPVASGINRIEFWIDNGGGAVLAATLAPGAVSYDYGVRPDGIYTMFVRAFDNAGNQADSAPIVITNDSAPPLTFTLDAPAALPALPAITEGPAAAACATTPTYVTSTPTLTWQASSDATSGLAGYDVYIDGALVGSTPAGTQSWPVTPALSGGSHTWHVVARDSFGLTRSSTPAPYSVRIDGASPTVTSTSPATGSFTTDTTPTLGWTTADDNCGARVEVTLDGSVVAVVAASVTDWTPAAALAEGPHAWSIRTFDSAGNVTAGASSTIVVDTTAPTAVSAIGPPNTGTVPEGMLTFTWSAGTDAGSGVHHYDITIDGVVQSTGLTAATSGPSAIHAGPHTWSIRAFDAVGNSATFAFSFTASAVADTTAPNAFNLLTPANGAGLTSGDALTWAPSWDFNGITNYRVLIDNALAGTVAGNVTTFTPATGVGLPICSIDFDPATTAGCLTGPTYSQGQVAGSTTTLPALASSAWSTGAHTGYSATSSSFGVGDVGAGTGWDGDRTWTAAEYSITVPATGADLRFEHRYDTQMNGQNAFDGGTVEVMVDTAGDGFGNDVWASTCNVGSPALLPASLDCTHDIVEADAGGYSAVLGGPAANNSLAYHATFSGNPGGIVQTKVHLAKFVGKNVKLRFRLGGDSCYVGQPAARNAFCPTPLKRSVWQIDNLVLANPSLLPGLHTWQVQAVDPSGNLTNSNQTWSFNLS